MIPNKMPTQITKEILMEIEGRFTWDFGCHFCIETFYGLFEWSDPGYMGDNIIRPFNGSFTDWIKESNIPFGRDKGNHIIKDYIGEDFILIWETRK